MTIITGEEAKLRRLLKALLGKYEIEFSIRDKTDTLIEKFMRGYELPPIPSDVSDHMKRDIALNSMAFAAITAGSWRSIDITSIDMDKLRGR